MASGRFLLDVKQTWSVIDGNQNGSGIRNDLVNHTVLRRQSQETEFLTLFLENSFKNIGKIGIEVRIVPQCSNGRFTNREVLPTSDENFGYL